MRKQLTIKLGSKCNFTCKYCHSRDVEYQYNPDILNYIDKQDIDILRFSGGEPLLYKDIILNIMDQFRDRFVYLIVSNGSLLTPTLVHEFNKYHTQICLSYNGQNNIRESFYTSKKALDLLKHPLKLSSVIFNENNDVYKTIEEIRYLYSKLQPNQHLDGITFFPHLAHETVDSDIILIEETVSTYIRDMQQLFLEELKFCKERDKDISTSSFIHQVFEMYNDLETVHGVRCCNDVRHSISLSGDMLLCPYQTTTVGNIYTGLDINKVLSYLPDRCRQCTWFPICKNTCIVNVTDTPCRVFREMHTFIQSVLLSFK